VENLGLTATFWRGRRVMVTGHTGFKGAWLTLWLEALGAQVVGLSAGVPSEPSLYRLADVARGIDEAAGTALVNVWMENQRGEKVLSHGEAEISL